MGKGSRLMLEPGDLIREVVDTMRDVRISVIVQGCNAGVVTPWIRTHDNDNWRSVPLGRSEVV